MIGIFIDTPVVCSATAMLVLLAGHGTPFAPIEGIHLVQKAMTVLVGEWGASFVAIIVILFAFSSIVANYIYAENNLYFLHLDNPTAIWGLRIATCCTVILGTVMSFPLMWQLTDIIMACMAITNLTAILLLSPWCTLLPVIICDSANLVCVQRSILCATRILNSSSPRTHGMKYHESNCNYRSIDPVFLLKSP